MELTDDITVYRRYGGSSEPLGSPWFSLIPYNNADEARAMLALPNENLATNVAVFTIPKGTQVLIGPAASQTDNLLLFGRYASGGGYQLYLPDPTKARLYNGH